MDVVNELVTGALFAGRYRIVRRVAAGGMGAVYEVIHVETDRRRALKIMHPHMFQSDELRQRFQREAKIAAHIESEFIVDVFDAGIDEKTSAPFLVMEFLRGEELGERLKRQGRLSPSEVLTYLHQIALALDKTHEAAIVHRDLKPANIFLTERAEGGVRVKILDFGIAKIVAEGATGGGATQSLGTPLYMAPEQFNPDARLTSAADIFALGMMTYTLLVGVPYWGDEARAGNIFALIAVAIRGPDELACVRAARHRVVLPGEFDAWFARITATAPTRRFPTAMAAVQALAEVFRLPLPHRAPTLSLTGDFDPPSPAQAQTRHLPSASFSEATIIGASSTTRPSARRWQALPFVMVGAGLVVLVIAVLVRLAPTDPESTEPPAAMSAGSSIASAPAPVVAIAKPETPSSGIGILAGKPLPSATASPVSSSEPARKKTLTTPVLKQRKHTWE